MHPTTLFLRHLNPALLVLPDVDECQRGLDSPSISEASPPFVGGNIGDVVLASVSSHVECNRVVTKVTPASSRCTR